MSAESLKFESTEERKIELRNSYKEQADRMRKKYPEIIGEIQEVAGKVGFKDVLINPSLQAVAQVDPEVFPDAVLWSERSIENTNILKKFAPEFFSKGIRIITVHEKEHLRGPAQEMIGAEERFIKKGEWRGIQELQEKLPRIKLFREHQTRLQSFIKLADYKDLFEKGRCPDIAEAIAIEEIFTDFTLNGPISLEGEVSSKTWREYLPFFKLGFINMISEKNKEIRGKLLKDYRSWQKEPQIFEKSETREKPIERLRDFIVGMSSELKKGGIPIYENGRINMDQFKGVYSQQHIEAQKGRLQDLREQWDRAIVSESRLSGILSKEQILRRKTLGETWEMLAIAVLHKKLGKNFFVCRTSEYDDVMNGVDGFIIDKKSGSVICAFDNVVAVPGSKLDDEKRQKILRRNRQVAEAPREEKAGANIDYGISFVPGALIPRKGQISRIPFFYLAASEEAVKKGLENFSKNGASLEEQKIFKALIDSFSEQIQYIKKGQMHFKLEERLKFFEAILEKLKDVVR